VFKRNDERTIYNVLYRDGKNGKIMMKRCAIKGITRDKEYDLTKGTPASELLYLSVNPNGEAEVLKIYFKPRPRLKKVITELDFANIEIRGRQSQGNLFSRYGIHKIVLKERGASTLGGQNIWFDEDIRRLNADGRGRLLGEFAGDDKIIVFTPHLYYITGYELTHHFPEDTVRVEKYRSDVVYTVAYFDDGQRYFYVKRFPALASEKAQEYLESDCRLVGMSDAEHPQLEVSYKGANAGRPADVVGVEEFIGIKSNKAKGKRVTTLDVDRLVFLKPVAPPEPEEEEPDDEPAEEELSDEVETTVGEVSESAEESELEDDVEPTDETELTDETEPEPLQVEPPVTVEIEIERTKKVDDTRNPQTEQLNLF
jgi:topoisomerase-4 subunit A